MMICSINSFSAVPMSMTPENSTSGKMNLRRSPPKQNPQKYQPQLTQLPRPPLQKPLQLQLQKQSRQQNPRRSRRRSSRKQSPNTTSLKIIPSLRSSSLPRPIRLSRVRLLLRAARAEIPRAAETSISRSGKIHGKVISLLHGRTPEEITTTSRITAWDGGRGAGDTGLRFIPITAGRINPRKNMMMTTMTMMTTTGTSTGRLPSAISRAE